VTLVEANEVFAACPHSNAVIAGLRDMKAQLFSYRRIAAAGITVVHQAATAVDGHARTVTLADGTMLSFDRLVIAPGSEPRFDALSGYDEAAAQVMPHAWQAGAQTLLLRRQLEAMADGGTVVMALPALPYRCPPASYERASLIAWYLKTRRPRSKLIVLDAKDTFSMQPQFQEAWNALYPNLEWVPPSSGGNPTAVDARAMTVSSDFETYKPAVANVVPPQRAGRIAVVAGVADRTGWCPVEAPTSESRLVPGVHVLGDAAIAGAVPKSAYAAHELAVICALAIATLLRDEAPAGQTFANTCYSLAAPDWGLSLSGTYQPVNGQWEAKGEGVITPARLPAEKRGAEAEAGGRWFDLITSEVFG
jgi:NADPH-dependent 2,4-dienoyl-CoA reductase/sulfur reductase-like enzyme